MPSNSVSSCILIWRFVIANNNTLNTFDTPIRYPKMVLCPLPVDPTMGTGIAQINHMPAILHLSLSPKYLKTAAKFVKSLSVSLFLSF